MQQNLTKTEREVLYLLSEEFLTVKQISIRRGVTPRAIRKIRQSLREKGLLSITNKKVPELESTPEHNGTNQIRLHGQEFNIKILFKDHKYNNIREKKGNTVEIDGNTVRLYKESVEIYSKTSFYAEDATKATAKSFKYWDRIINIIENDFKIIIKKHRSANIKIVNHHYAEINNGIAKEYNTSGEKLKIYTKEDGKLWFLIDNSFNLHEAETVHPDTAKQDIDAVKGFFNDIRENKPPTMSELMKVINNMAEINTETAAGLNTIVNYIKNKDINIDKPCPTAFLKIGYG